MARLFIAVQPDEEVLETAWSRLLEFHAKAPPGVRWVPRENLHFTLKFFGNVLEEDAARIVPAMERVVERAGPPFDLDLEGVGAFPSSNHPSVLWLGTGRGGEQICRLAELLEGELETQGFLRDERPFHPHLTFARAPGRAGASFAMVRFFGKMERGIHKVGSFRVRELVLYESETLPEGAVYRVREKVEL